MKLILKRKYIGIYIYILESDKMLKIIIAGPIVTRSPSSRGKYNFEYIYVFIFLLMLFSVDTFCNKQYVVVVVVFRCFMLQCTIGVEEFLFLYYDAFYLTYNQN